MSHSLFFQRYSDTSQPTRRTSTVIYVILRRREPKFTPLNNFRTFSRTSPYEEGTRPSYPDSRVSLGTQYVGGELGVSGNNVVIVPDVSALPSDGSLRPGLSLKRDFRRN